MINQLKTISKETIIYGIGGTAGSVISLFLLPVYTKFLTPEDYGYLAIISVFQSIIEITAVFGLSTGLFRYYLMATNEFEQQKVMNTCFWTQLLFLLVLALIVFPIIDRIAFILFGSTELSPLLSMVTVTGLLSAFGTFVFSFIRAKRKSLLFSIIQLIRVILTVLFSIYFVVVLKWNYKGIIIGNFIITIVVAVFVFAWVLRFVRFSISIFYFKKLLKFIYPIYIVNLFYYLLNFSDRFFLNHFLSKTDLGLYSFGNKIGTIVMIGIISPFSLAIVPYAFSIVKEDYFTQTYSKIIKYFIVILVYLSLIIFYFSKEIVLIVSNASYIEASNIVGPILLASIFYGLYYNISIAIDIAEKTYIATYIVLLAAIVSVTVNYFTIPYLGVYGSALATCTSNGVLFITTYYFSQKYYPIRYDVHAFYILMGVVIFYTAIYFGITFSIDNIFIVILLKILMCILFPILIFFLKIFDTKERIYIATQLRKYL